MEYDITLTSKNQELSAYISAPVNQLLEVVCTSFTCQTSILILTKNDYITITKNKGEGETKTFYFNDNYIEQNEEDFLALINDMLEHVGITVSANASHLLVFSSSEPFVIDSMSYNVQLLTGFFFKNTNLTSNENNEITSACVPYYCSTPVLYLISNIGTTNYINNDSSSSAATGMKTLMKINNSMSRLVPIVCGNCDFTVRTCASVLSHAYFKVIDQNLRDITLLNPFTITLKIRTVEPQQ